MLNPLVQDINKFVLEKIAPSVVSHGGRIDVVSLEDNKLVLGLSGACSTCSLDTFTKEGISEFLLNEFPTLDDCEVIDLEEASEDVPHLSTQVKES